MRSKTCAGFSSCLNLLRNFTPWLSPLFELTKTSKGLVQDGGQVAFQNPSESMLLRAVGGMTDTLQRPRGHLVDNKSLHVVCTIALHQRQRQSCKRRTLPHVLSHTVHLALTGRFPSSHWCGIEIPSSSSMISFPIDANVVHLQLLVARTAHRL